MNNAPRPMTLAGATLGRAGTTIAFAAFPYPRQRIRNKLIVAFVPGPFAYACDASNIQVLFQQFETCTSSRIHNERRMNV